MLMQEQVKISRGFISRVKFTNQNVDHSGHTSGSGPGAAFHICREGSLFAYVHA